MTLRHFLDASYATLVDDHRRQGAGLVEALDASALWRAGGPPEQILPGTPSEEVPPEVSRKVEQENQESLAELQKLMAGVGGFR